MVTCDDKIDNNPFHVDASLKSSNNTRHIKEKQVVKFIQNVIEKLPIKYI